MQVAAVVVVTIQPYTLAEVAWVVELRVERIRRITGIEHRGLVRSLGLVVVLEPETIQRHRDVVVLESSLFE
jgi:hypothetical protein